MAKVYIQKKQQQQQEQRLVIKFHKIRAQIFMLIMFEHILRETFIKQQQKKNKTKYFIQFLQ